MCTRWASHNRVLREWLKADNMTIWPICQLARLSIHIKPLLSESWRRLVYKCISTVSLLPEQSALVEYPKVLCPLWPLPWWGKRRTHLKINICHHSWYSFEVFCLIWLCTSLPNILFFVLASVDLCNLSPRRHIIPKAKSSIPDSYTHANF